MNAFTRHIAPLLLTSGVTTAHAQVVATPLDLSDGQGRPHWISAPSHDVAYAGVSGGGTNSKIFCRTFDAGESWETLEVPEPLDRGCMSVHALNDTVVWSSMSDGVGSNGGALWRSTDAGTTWTQLTTTEFGNGFLNFSHFTTLDSGVAVGDPVDGYFEIHTTTDGGATWVRTPEADMPAMLSGEYGLAHDYAAVGRHIWFDTNKGRIFMSNDLGLHWTLSPIPAGPPTSANVTFSDPLHGASHHVLSSYPVYITEDGGQTWSSPQPIAPMQVSYIEAIPGVPGAFIFTAQGPSRVLATTDNFQSYSVLGTDPAYSVVAPPCMYDASIGWLSTFQTFSDHAMFRIQDVMMGGLDIPTESASMQLFPNPVSEGATLVTVDLRSSTNGELRLCDLEGRILRTIPLTGGSHRAHIFDVHGLGAGTYLLTFNDGITRSTRRLVVQ